LAITALLALAGIALLFLAKFCIEYFEGPIADSWIDLALVLTAYLLFFFLRPLRESIMKRLNKKTKR